MNRTYLVLRFLLVIVAAPEECSSIDEMYKVLTYFARTDEKGLYIDALDKYTWFKIKIRPSNNKQTTTTLNIQPQMVKSGKNVTVVWSGVEDATAEDFIALYCPETSTNNDYLDYFNVEVSPTFKQGTGKHSVQLTNLRTNCEFRYFRNISKQRQELVTASNIVMFEGGPEIPLQIHLSLTGDPTQMRVMWVSGTDQKPIVKYGRSKTLDLMAKGKSHTYRKSDFCSVNGKFIDPGFIHDVLLTNLQPSANYYYSCGVPGHMSDILHFKTPPLVGSEASFKFIAYGDMGIVTAAHSTAKHVLKDVENGHEFIVHLGDVSYARGFGYIWEQWHALIQPFSSIVPYMVGVGNHEQGHNDVSPKDISGVTGNGFHPWWGNYGDDSNGECGVPIYYRFHMPDNGNHVWWYSYDYGMVHFIMISTEHDMGKGSKQYTWLENDLKNVDHSKTPWVIVGGHRSMYSTAIVLGDYIIGLAMQVHLEDLFHQYKVDLALWGHYHSYERTCAVYNNTCSNEGTVHIVIGAAGYHQDTASYFPYAWSLFYRQDDPYGYGRITVANRSALLWEYVANRPNKVVDYTWLRKN